VYFSKVNEEEDQEYLVDHSIVVYLLSDSGEFLEFFTQSAQVADIVERIGRRVKSSR
jgi:cytochrome oxidase Cu insertion factor (SCO1/SenC/PrrC family)